MLNLVIGLPAAVALVLLVVPASAPRALFFGSWIAAGAVDLGLVVALWIGSAAHSSPGFQDETSWPWIPTAGIGYHVGVDGISLPLIAMTAVLFLVCAIASLGESRHPKAYVVVFLFLQTVSLGLFASLDLILFFLFFDLSIVGMYFVIAFWGHGDRERSALKFFLYTFIGSLALLLGFIGLYLSTSPHTFDLVRLARANPLATRPVYGALVLLAIGIGLAVKTPTVPFHTWLPPAHTDAPPPGSAILAGVLLKMGTYGFVRIAMPVLPEAWHAYALVFVIVGVVSALYGALVAMAQTDFKRMIAYTSVNHMGYVILALGAAAMVPRGDSAAGQLAVTGAVTQMVSHGLITGALFLCSGVLYERGRNYDMGQYSGLAAVAPTFAGITALAAFASLGLPGFSGFIAEFQIFAGSLSGQPVATAIALLGILFTAALFLRALQRIFLGELRLPEVLRRAGRFGDLMPREALAIVPLLGLSIAIGVYPAFLLDVIEPAVRGVATAVAR